MITLNSPTQPIITATQTSQTPNIIWYSSTPTIVNSSITSLGQISQIKNAKLNGIIAKSIMNSRCVKNEKKIFLPYNYAIQQVTSRHKMKCFMCREGPINKRLFVSYKHLKENSCTTVVHVYCKNCWSDFLKECEQKYGNFLNEMRQELSK